MGFVIAGFETSTRRLVFTILAAEQVKILIFLVKIYFFPIYVNNFCDAGQVPILRNFEACIAIPWFVRLYVEIIHYLYMETGLSGRVLILRPGGL